MTRLKSKEAKNMNEQARKEKLHELKMELLRSKSGKENKIKVKEIKKNIARILMLNK